ncbi:MAG: hypothetical protein IMW98_05505 [Firmicutes bacterium]|nr:hypothetical protein [Bacillota bacterium]
MTHPTSDAEAAKGTTSLAAAVLGSDAASAWLDQLEQAAMRDDEMRSRLQRIFLANLASIRQDGGELYHSWLELLENSLEDLRHRRP